MSIFLRAIELIFGCRHPSLTWPQGPKGKATITCNSCGKTFAYDWSTMRIGQVIKP
jgi:hypothetical protein